MAKKLELFESSPQKLSNTYHILYELQAKLGISDEYLLTTARGTVQDIEYRDDLQKLLSSSNEARDTLIAWHLTHARVELNVTISLLTAKIKFMEYKLGRCDGLDLHQACSLSLVDFCNILSDKIDTQRRKKSGTKHSVCDEANIPVWLSHYRNQICHVPSESPCISILVPLVVKSLNYLRSTFWDVAFPRDTFDLGECKRLFEFLVSKIQFQSRNQHIQLKKGFEVADENDLDDQIIRVSKACKMLRRMLLRYPDQTLTSLTVMLTQWKPKSVKKNVALVLEQIILTKRFEMFIHCLVSNVHQNPHHNILWLRRMIHMIGLSDRPDVKLQIRSLGLCASNKILKGVNIPSVKCCLIAYQLVKMEKPFDVWVRSLIRSLRYKLLPLLGKDRLKTLLKMTRIVDGQRFVDLRNKL